MRQALGEAHNPLPGEIRQSVERLLITSVGAQTVDELQRSQKNRQPSELRDERGALYGRKVWKAESHTPDTFKNKQVPVLANPQQHS